MDEIPLLISGGSEIKRLRKIAGNVLERFNHLLLYERRARFIFTQWNYTLDASRDEDPGHMADRSLEAVTNSEGVIAIVGNTVPSITRLEIRRVYELRRMGQHRELWFLVSRRTTTDLTPDRVSLADFIKEIEGDFGRLRVYHPVEDSLDFQASLMMEMLPFVVRRAGTAFGPLRDVAS